MDKGTIKKMVGRCRKDPAVAAAQAFLLVGIDREVSGMGDGGFFARTGEDGGWKVRRLYTKNRDAVERELEDVVGIEDLYDEEEFALDEGELDQSEDEKRADCSVSYLDHGVSAAFFAHVNKTGDGLHIKEDLVSIDRGSGPRELPIVYWNTGREPVKVDGVWTAPGAYRVSRPGDPARLARRELKREQDECLMAQLKRHPGKLDPALLQAVQEQIVEWEPDWTEAQARMAAEMFLSQGGGL